MEELLKVILLEEFGFEGHYAFPPGYPPFAQEALMMLGIELDRILLVDRPTVYGSAFFTTTISHFRAHRFPAVIRRLRDQLYEAAGSGLGPFGRIWVDRGSSAKRQGRVINGEEVQFFAERHGFRIMDLGQHSFRDQISIDRGADVLMGPHGSAFVHCGFMKDKRDIIEIFSPEYINPSVIQLCMALQHSYQQIVPTKAWHTPYKYGLDILIDIDQLELALSSVELRRTG
jgi:capsular polysaccharide biosynthesis protein